MNRRAATIVGLVRTTAGGLADLILPQVCCGCEAGEVSTGGLCGACNIQLLDLVSTGYCPRCGATLGPNVPVRQDGCFACPNPLPRFETVVRLGPYASPLREAILDLKYRRRETMRRRLGRMLAHALIARHEERPFDLVMPIPMHWRRRLGRSCDHARLISQTVGRELGLPVGHELIRIRHTPQQVHLPRSRRIENVRRAFAVTDTACVEGANILLIDDVTTTGATANEATRTLLAGGASKVTLAVVAKAEPPSAYHHQ